MSVNVSATVCLCVCVDGDDMTLTLSVIELLPLSSSRVFTYALTCACLCVVRSGNECVHVVTVLGQRMRRWIIDPQIQQSGGNSNRNLHLHLA